MPHRLLFRLPNCFGAALCLWLAVGAAANVGAQSPTPGGFSFFNRTAPTPKPTPTPTPVATSTPSDYQPAKVLKRGPLAYPVLASLNRIEGIVGIRFAIDEEGKVKEATVYQSSRSVMLDAVVKTRGILEWTFQPATLAGKPIPSTYTQDFEFRLDPAEQRQLALKRLAAPIGTPDPPYPAEALALKPRPRGDCTVGVFWTKAGHVDIINLLKSSGSNALDHAALRFAYENWRIDPKLINEKTEKEQFSKVLTFTPPDDGSGTPPPLAPAVPAPSPAATPKKSSN